METAKKRNGTEPTLLLITVEYNRRWGLKVLNPDLPTKVNYKHNSRMLELHPTFGYTLLGVCKN